MASVAPVLGLGAPLNVSHRLYNFPTECPLQNDNGLALSKMKFTASVALSFGLGGPFKFFPIESTKFPAGVPIAKCQWPCLLKVENQGLLE